MKYHEVAEPIEASSLYTGALLFSFGFGVRFNVGDFQGQCMPRIFLRCLLLIHHTSNHEDVNHDAMSTLFILLFFVVVRHERRCPTYT